MDPTTLNVVLIIIQGLLGLVCFFLKQSYNELKEDNKTLWKELAYIKDKYFKKEDFMEFKKELWMRFDRLEDDLNSKIQELKK